ncbi:MAG: DUF1146 domain-containing protein [Solobacterium sp.]|nr:DUF1146 domain-containing protein [Solobacterium sp.]
MELSFFFLKTGIYLLAFILSFYGLSALDYSRFLKQGHTAQAQVLYWILVLSLAYLSGSFLISFLFIQ